MCDNPYTFICKKQKWSYDGSKIAAENFNYIIIKSKFWLIIISDGLKSISKKKWIKNDGEDIKNSPDTMYNNYIVLQISAILKCFKIDRVHCRNFIFIVHRRFY